MQITVSGIGSITNHLFFDYMTFKHIDSFASPQLYNSYTRMLYKQVHTTICTLYMLSSAQ